MVRRCPRPSLQVMEFVMFLIMAICDFKVLCCVVFMLVNDRTFIFKKEKNITKK